MKKSAGILLYRMKNGAPEIFLVHPGGPFWAKKDEGAWGIPKGEFLQDEDPLKAAQREFLEETGQAIDGDFILLTPIKQKGGKLIYAWAVSGDIDAEKIQSNTFEMEYPPRSGRKQTFPEVDRAGWFTIEAARQKMNESQFALVEELLLKIGFDS